MWFQTHSCITENVNFLSTLTNSRTQQTQGKASMRRSCFNILCQLSFNILCQLKGRHNKQKENNTCPTGKQGHAWLSSHSQRRRTKKRVKHFKALKEKNKSANPEFYKQQNILSENEDEIQTFSDKRNSLLEGLHYQKLPREVLYTEQKGHQ